VAFALITLGHEVKRTTVGGVHRRPDGCLPGQCNGGRREAGSSIGVVGRIAPQIATPDVAVVILSHAIDHGWIGLQPHAPAQPADKDAGDLTPFAGDGRFLLNDRG